MKKIRIRTFYHADPVGVVPGGIDTFIRGLYKWAPDDLEFSLVGMTTRPDLRPIGQWSPCSMGRREFDFFPVFAEEDAGGRSRIPLTVRHSFGVMRHRREVMRGFDVFEVHRMEPMLTFKWDGRPKNAFFHQDLAILRRPDADIRWRRFPGLYFWLEDQLIPGLASGYCVRESGVATLRSRFPELADHLAFVPTWVDTELFQPESDPRLAEAGRLALRQRLGLRSEAKVVVTVGRIDTQKNPALLLDSFARLKDACPDAALVYIGDGVLRKQLEVAVDEAGLHGRVHFLGLQTASEIAAILRAADVFALSSAYEGMPMALLEALGSGLPVVTTDVGEVRKVVSDACGEIVSSHEPEAFSRVLGRTLGRLHEVRGAHCVAAIQPYRPHVVLAPVYDNYRRLGGA